MLEKIETNAENISKIANAEFNRRTKGYLEYRAEYIKRDWYQEAEEMLTDYNRVVDILNDSV